MSNFRPDRVDFVERRTFLKEIAPTESIFIRSPRWEVVKPPLHVPVFRDRRWVVECVLPNNRKNLQFRFAKDIADRYIAFYPNAVKSGDVVTMEIPADQHYTAFTFANNTYPMYATNDATGNFLFHSNAGVLSLKFKSSTEDLEPNGAYSVTVGAIRIYAESDALAGTMKYYDGTYIGLVSGTTTNEVIMHCGTSGVEISDDQNREFYIILPEGALMDEFVVEVYAPGATPGFDDPIESFQGAGHGLNTIVGGKITLMPERTLPHD